MTFALFLFSRYNNDLELEDAIHTAILTLKVCCLLYKYLRCAIYLHCYCVSPLLSVICTPFYLCVSGEFWGSDDGGEHWGGDLQRGRLQKTHPSWGERLPGSHCVNTPSLVTGLSGHISRQRQNSTVANSLMTHFSPWNHSHSDRVWPHCVMAKLRLP